MRKTANALSVVILGRWNPYVFSPAWVSTHLVEIPPAEIGIALPIGDREAPTQLILPNFQLAVSSSRVVLTPTVQNQTGLDFLIKCARRLLELLPHTPVSAIAVNLVLEETEQVHLVAGKFHFEDEATVDSEIFKLQQTLLRRDYRVSDWRQFNLLITFADGRAQFECNNHFVVDNSVQAIERFTKEFVHQVLLDSIQFANSNYGYELTLEGVLNEGQ